MQRTNLPTIIAIAIAVCLAGGLVFYALKDKGDASSAGQPKTTTRFEVVTSLEDPAEFQLAAVPAGPKIVLDVTLQSPADDEVKLADLVSERALVVYLDTDIGDRRLKAVTRDLRRVILGGDELNFPIVLILPRGTSAGGASDFVRKRQLRIPPYVDADGEFADANGWPSRTAALIDGEGTVILRFDPCTDWDERFGLYPRLLMGLGYSREGARGGWSGQGGRRQARARGAHRRW